jgi:hypothetical protein
MSPWPIDLRRVQQGLARLDALVEAHPELQEPEAQARLTAWLEGEQRGVIARKGKQTGDVKTRARMQRLREKRKQAGVKVYELWLDPNTAALLAQLKHPGESLTRVIRRVLLALQVQDTPGPARASVERPICGTS